MALTRYKLIVPSVLSLKQSLFTVTPDQPCELQPIAFGSFFGKQSANHKCFCFDPHRDSVCVPRVSSSAEVNVRLIGNEPRIRDQRKSLSTASEPVCIRICWDKDGERGDISNMLYLGHLTVSF